MIAGNEDGSTFPARQRASAWRTRSAKHRAHLAVRLDQRPGDDRDLGVGHVGGTLASRFAVGAEQDVGVGTDHNEDKSKSPANDDLGKPRPTPQRISRSTSDGSQFAHRQNANNTRGFAIPALLWGEKVTVSPAWHWVLSSPTATTSSQPESDPLYLDPTRRDARP